MISKTLPLILFYNSVKKIAYLAVLFFGFGLVQAAELDSPPHNKASILGPEQVALVINDADPSSVRVGQYYQSARSIPAKNVDCYCILLDNKKPLTL